MTTQAPGGARAGNDPNTFGLGPTSGAMPYDPLHPSLISSLSQAVHSTRAKVSPSYFANHFAPDPNDPINDTRPGAWGAPPNNVLRAAGMQTFDRGGPTGSAMIRDLHASQAGQAPVPTDASPPNIGAAGGGYSPYGPGGGGVGPLEGLDFSKPGALEQYQADSRGYFGQPTMSEMFAQGANQQYGGPQKVAQNAQGAYDKFATSTPANMDPYYANERRKAEENINKSVSARGIYGSSAANDMIGEADTNLAADQAKAEAQYGLNRGSLLGSLAQGADSSSLGASANQRGWTSMLGNLTQGADQSGLSRVTAGANVAGAAQGAQTTRGQNAFHNQLEMDDRQSGIMGHGYDNIFGADMGLMKDTVGLNTGTAAEGYNQASNAAQQSRTDVNNVNNLLGQNTTYGKGLYDMFAKQPAPQPSPMPAPAGGYGYQGPPADQNYGTTNWYYPNQ